jgi:glycosyltransferase involved in cell wall biosynthesis
MLISVITPTRNRTTSFLNDCVASVACQRMPEGWEVEHVICDDCSDPGERAALEQLSQRHRQVRVVWRSASGGVSAARNAAFLASLGDVVVDLDDDDMLPMDALARRAAHLVASGQPWSCGDMLKVDEHGRYLIGRDLARDPDSVPTSQDEFLQCLLDGTVYAWAGTRTYLRSALLVAGPWDESFVVAEDLEHWLRLTALTGPPAWFPGHAVIYREKERSLGIDAVNDGSMDIQAHRARARYRGWPNLPDSLPTWDGLQDSAVSAGSVPT